MRFLDEPAGIEAWQKYEGRSIDSYFGFESNDLYRTVEDLAADGWELTENVPGFPVVFDQWFNQGSIRLVDQNGDGNITADDISRSDKNLLPTTQYGINLGFSYKNFEVSALIQGQAGGYYRDASFVYNHAIFDDAWSSENTDAAYPIPTPFYAIGGHTYNSDFWLKKSDYTRLKNVNLTYRIPAGLLEKWNLDRASVFVRGNNVAILKSSNSNVDPDGVGGSFLLKSWQFGINFNF